MSAHRPRGGHVPVEPRSYHSHTRDDFYDDRRSRSRSRSPDQRYSSPDRRRSPPHDISRALRAPAQQSYNSGRRSPTYRDRSRGRDESYDSRRSPSPRRNRYYDRDQPRADDYDRRPRGRDRSRTPGRDRSPSRGRPSREVMMDGLAPHLTEKDITEELRTHYHVDHLDDVRIIRDRLTKLPREYGFLRFMSVEDAQDFMDRNYPTIYLYGDSTGARGDSDARVRIAFGKERKDVRPDDSDWICPSCRINNFSTRLKCFRCGVAKTEMATVAAKIANVGDNDVSPDNASSQFLLVRGLEGSVNEDLFAKGISKLNKPTGSTAQTASSGKKRAKVASTTGDANLGAKDGTLRRVLLVRDRRSNESWRYGFAEYASIEDAQAALTRYNSFDRFTIASKQVLVSHIHAGVFVPVLSPNPSLERFLFSPLNNPSMKLAYWDEGAYLTEVVLSAPEASDPDPRPRTIKDTESESLKPIKETDKVKKRKGQPDNNSSATKKPAPSHLQFWSSRHAELHGIKPKAASSSQASSENGDGALPAASSKQSYADPTRHCCYLCMRQFKDSAEANQHERVSELHRANVKNKGKVQKALGKLENHGIPILKGTSSNDYRDRAKERRKIYGVVNKKGEQLGKASSKKDAQGQGASDDDDEKTPIQQSKGASLLSKMGYTAGQGLGASGEGMKTPLSQDVYVAGVGLGAQGGKLGDAVEVADRETKGGWYSGWVERGKEGMRARYRDME